MKQPDYQSEPTDLDRLLNLISFTAMAGLLIYSAWIYPQLPDRIPTHFNIRGEPDDYGPKTIFLLFPGIAFALFVLFSVISRKPQNYNYPFKITPENADRQYRLANALMTTIKTTVILLMGYLAYGTAQVALGKSKGLGGSFLAVFLILTFGSIAYYFWKAYKAK